MLKNAKELRSASGGKAGGALKKRFWKDVTVQEVDGEQLSLNPTTIACVKHENRRSANFPRYSTFETPLY